MKDLRDTYKGFSRPPGLQLGRNRFYTSLTALGAFATAGIAGFGATHGWTRVAIIAVGWPLSILAAARAQRLDFRLGDRGVVVQNFWRLYDFEWSDVRLVRMAILSVGFAPQGAIGFFLHDRRTVLVQATPGGKASRELIFDAISKLAPPNTPVGADARLQD